MEIVYHASPQTDLKVINPGHNNEGRVFAAVDFDMAHAFLGREGRGWVMGQHRENGIPIFTERVFGAFEFRYRDVPGAIYKLDAGPFFTEPERWNEEVITDTAVTPIAPPIVYTDVRNKLREMDKAGQIKIEWWSGQKDDQAILDYWLRSATDSSYHSFVLQTARAFLEYNRPYLRQEFEQRLHRPR
ncbi:MULTISPECIES: hypothetical protein [Paenibacillus]|uniref:hypothetical protein n=1 Tax=Paenibacillus TaxID=44249 RepID=UPI000467B989|nr:MULTISPECIES: hypothetical protein [Paenibacillus]KGP77615.1 hypothetical protein P363_0133110 [Paenibacillus sp. MAEPY1]KGP77708.1 hypothetical protein P364_0132060 [Paenibacillus sp. MAEPY2]OZQ62824.1 hypothetical protein CA599_25525 [Paenibacillus taichungensis]